MQAELRCHRRCSHLNLVSIWHTCEDDKSDMQGLLWTQTPSAVRSRAADSPGIWKWHCGTAVI